MLYVLQKAKPRLLKEIVKYADSNTIKTICEIAYNTLRGNIKLRPYALKKLNRYKKELRRLSCPKSSLSSKRNIIVQRGAGFVPTLIGSILAGLIGQYLDRYVKEKQ